MRDGLGETPAWFSPVWATRHRSPAGHAPPRSRRLRVYRGCGSTPSLTHTGPHGCRGLYANEEGWASGALVAVTQVDGTICGKARQDKMLALLGKSLPGGGATAPASGGGQSGRRQERSGSPAARCGVANTLKVAILGSQDEWGRGRAGAD